MKQSVLIYELLLTTTTTAMEQGTTVYFIIMNITDKKKMNFDLMFSIELHLVFDDPDWKLVRRFAPVN